MNRKGRAGFYLVWFYMLFSTLVLISERSIIPDESWLIYVVGKCVIVWGCLPAAYALYHNPRSFSGNLTVGLSMMIYPAFCGYWRINYEMAVFELLVGYALCFYPTRRVFAIAAVGCVTLFSIVRWIRWDYLRSQFSNPAPLDGILAAAAMGGVASILFYFINRERTWREAALNRFGLIGQHTSNIIHDVKNLVATPALLVSTLERKLGPSADAETREILHEMQTSLSRTNRLIRDLNEMARLTEPEARARISMRTLVLEVADLLQSQLRGVSLDIDGDLELQADRALLYSVFVSLMMNAADQFRRVAVPSPRLRVVLSEGLCCIRDNAGGFDPAVLRQLASGGRSTSTKPDGTGIGLFLVSNALIELGGSADFRNGEDGALIELRFG